MSPTLSSVAFALLYAAVGGLFVWVVTTPFRRHSLRGLLASVVLTGITTSVAAVLGSLHEMLLPMHEHATGIIVAAATGLAATITAGVAMRRVASDSAVLRAAIAELGAGRVPAAGGARLSKELEDARSELRQTARALAEARERKQALESSRRELVSWVSHDLRTPLAGLRAMAEALEDGIVEDPAQYYKQICASVERLNLMVDDLFDLSRIQAGVVSRDIENIALDDLVSDCVAALEPLATAQGVRLTGSVAGAAAVSGNGPELNRALTNLVANAIRHTRAQGRVDVRVVVSVTPHPLVEVIVRDECGGIPPAHLDRVFDIGFRGESARTPHAEYLIGAGLGLAITRGIVEAHAGTVEVENAPGGCQFRVRLPASAAAG